jgi:hypothetical protein
MASEPKIRRPLILSEILLLLFILTDFLKQGGLSEGEWQEIQRMEWGKCNSRKAIMQIMKSLDKNQYFQQLLYASIRFLNGLLPCNRWGKAYC